MAITRERKEELVAQYLDLLEKSNGFVIIQYGGLGVSKVDGMRNAVRKADGFYAVTKNTLFTKALQQYGWNVPSDLLKGPTAVAFGLENFPGVAKAVLDYSGEREVEGKLVIKGGMMVGDIINPSQVEAVSKLPTLDELRAQLAGLVVAPAEGIVNVIYGATGQVVNVIQAYLDDKDGDAA